MKIYVHTEKQTSVYVLMPISIYIHILTCILYIYHIYVCMQCICVYKILSLKLRNRKIHVENSATSTER